MKMMICLHGNPLQGQEFETLLPSLEKKGFHPIIHKRPIKGSKLEPLLQSINATAKVSGGTRFSLVAYSWGAYLALSYLNRFPENVTGVVLINPLVDDRTPIHACYRWLSIPLIRTIAFRMRRRMITSNYLSRTFDPLHPSVEAKAQLEPFLSQVPVWMGSTAYKKLMNADPLSVKIANDSIPIKVLFGGKDKIAPMKEQQSIIKQFGNPISLVYPEAGHALPWTHSEVIINEISNFL